MGPWLYTSSHTHTIRIHQSIQNRSANQTWSSPDEQEKMRMTDSLRPVSQSTQVLLQGSPMRCRYPKNHSKERNIPSLNVGPPMREKGLINHPHLHVCCSQWIPGTFRSGSWEALPIGAVIVQKIVLPNPCQLIDLLDTQSLVSRLLPPAVGFSNAGCSVAIQG